MSLLRCYSAYGERLASDVVLPELEEIEPGPARWMARAMTSLAPMTDAVELGAEVIFGDVHARLFRHADGHRILVEDTGTFDISRDGALIGVLPLAGEWDDFVRAHLTGRVLATALYLDGLLPLHGSAVATRDGVVGFLAPKGFGKSSLALALAKAGAGLVSDDTLPIEVDAARAWPGVHGLRVHDDVLEAVGGAEGPHRTREGKHFIRNVGQERGFAHPTALAALYLLVPVAPDGTDADRVLAPPLQAAISIVAHVKVGGMLGRDAAPVMLDRAARIAGQVPVYQLVIPRDLAALPAMARAILSWHGVPEP